MAIVGLGTDIVEISRIESMLERHGEKLAQRILAEVELMKFARLKQPGRFLAKRFAAKEAAAKALGTGIADGVCFTHLVVSNNMAGKPELTLTGRAKQIADQMGVCACTISISDEKHYAVATVILEN